MLAGGLRPASWMSRKKAAPLQPVRVERTNARGSGGHRGGMTDSRQGEPRLRLGRPARPTQSSFGIDRRSAQGGKRDSYPPPVSAKSDRTTTGRPHFASERLAKARQPLRDHTSGGGTTRPFPPTPERGYVRSREDEQGNVGLILPNVESILTREREAAIKYGLRQSASASSSFANKQSSEGNDNPAWQLANTSNARPYPFSAFPLAPHLQQQIGQVLLTSPEETKSTPIQSLALNALVGPSKSGRYWEEKRKKGEMESLGLPGMDRGGEGEESQGGEGGEREGDGRGEEESVRIVLGAETGSGKTMAYLLPLLHRLKLTQPPLDRDSLSTDTAAASSQDDELVTFPDFLSDPTPNSASKSSRPRSRSASPKNPKPILFPRAIVLAPTHELTRQSTRLAKRLTAGFAMRVVGTSSTSDSGTGGKSGACDVLFGTEGMVRKCLGMPVFDRAEGAMAREVKGKDMRVAGTVDGAKVDWVVIDEADIMLGRDFAPSVLSLISHIESLRPASAAPLNLILVSATFPSDLSRLLTSSPLLASRPFLKLLSPGLHRLPLGVVTTFAPYTRGQDPGHDVVRAVTRSLAEDARERNARVEAEAEGESEGEMGDVQGGKGGWAYGQKTKVVVFANAAKAVDRLALTMQDKGIPCVTWTGEGAHVYRAGEEDRARTKEDRRERGRALAKARRGKGAAGLAESGEEAFGEDEDEGKNDKDGKEEMQQLRVRGKDGVLAHFLSLPGTREEQERIARRKGLSVDAMDEGSSSVADSDGDHDETSTMTATAAATSSPFDLPNDVADSLTAASPAARRPPTFRPSNSTLDRTPRVLITTSLLSRGLDFHPSTSTVILMDRPKNVIDFVHRAGRVGRVGPGTGGQGRFGRVVLMGVTKGEVFGDGVGGASGAGGGKGPGPGGDGSTQGRGRRGGKQAQARAKRGPFSWAGVRGVLQRSMDEPGPKRRRR